MRSINNILRTVSALLLCYPVLGFTHEYWLDPIESTANVGSKIIMDVRNGQNYSGAGFPFDPNNFKSVVISSEQSANNYSGRLGDYPAIHFTPTDIGLHSVSLETNQKTLVYDSFSEFEAFLSYHGLDNIREQHVELNLPLTDISEHYFRSAKTLIKIVVNQKAESNLENHSALKPVGSLFEMVAMQDPYADGIDSFSLKLLYAGKPLPARQVEMFWKGSQLLRLTTTTDIDGVATFRTLGKGDYMFNAVQVLESENAAVQWSSYWASLTFEL